MCTCGLKHMFTCGLKHMCTCAHVCLYGCICAAPRSKDMHCAFWCENQSINNAKYHDIIIKSFGPPLSPMWCVCICLSTLWYIKKNINHDNVFCVVFGVQVSYLCTYYPHLGIGDGFGWRVAINLDVWCHCNKCAMNMCIDANMLAYIYACMYKNTYVHACICACNHNCAVTRPQ